MWEASTCTAPLQVPKLDFTEAVARGRAKPPKCERKGSQIAAGRGALEEFRKKSVTDV